MDNQTTPSSVSRETQVPSHGKKAGVLKKILIGLAALVIALVIVFIAVVAVQPSEFRITRSATVSAPPETVYAQVNDFHKWQAWSPWAKMDPAAKNTFEGPSAGTGATFRWVGNAEVGEGSMTITESHPSDLILIKLEFLKPFPATNTTEFTFKPQGDQTVVTWTMSGRNGFVGKAFCLVMNMDKMVGGDFEKGLRDMKTAAEAAAKDEGQGQPKGSTAS
jgi:hypothetical protein